MNFNDNPEKLKKEEQIVLDKLIQRMNKVIEQLDNEMKNYISEVNNADISINPDEYSSRVYAQNRIANTKKERKKLLQDRDELYDTRLLLQYENSQESGIEEIKIGLHGCGDLCEKFIISWTTPLGRHYTLDNASVDYKEEVTGKYGEKYYTNYKLLVKNKVEIRFNRVVKALNLFPGLFDTDMLQAIKGTGFVSDVYLEEMIKQFNPDAYNPEEAANIISDEFLQELLERRSTPEFKNIVFSIQKKQGEIIQAPYNRNIIVQGCAGSGKSMIMLHRLPILLYDNPNSLKRNGLYVITPSQQYVQLAENMRHQLEIFDINMGTIEQYYDYCITKYTGHKAGEYGKINYSYRISAEQEQYIYSQKCILDICKYFDSISEEGVSLEKAYSLLSVKNNDRRASYTYAQKISNRLLEIQNILNVNNEIVMKYFKGIRNVVDALRTLSTVLCYRKNAVIRKITKEISDTKENINKAEKELEKLNPEKNEDAIKNRKNKIESAQRKILNLQKEICSVEDNTEYFATLNEFNQKIELILEPFSVIKNEFSQNKIEDIYNAIDKTGQLIGGFFMISWEFSKIEDLYEAYLGTIKSDVDKAEKYVEILQKITDKYLKFDYYNCIIEEREILSNTNTNAIKKAYEIIMENIGIQRDKSGKMSAIKCSPYIYLQVLYCYQGTPAYREALLAIDEAQGIAPEEIRLLKNINGKNVIFNMFGDIYQHIEGTKGVDSWDEFSEIFDFDYYEMQENYRNASQVTEYCNHIFGMKMNPINTPGKGVHELKNNTEFESEMITQLLNTQRAGLAAILVSNEAEARYMLDKFSLYKHKFHNMTDEEFTIHRTKWNIMCVYDAKGLEFSSVIVLSGRMSRNEKYIAFTRALDDLYIYSEVIDITGYGKKTKKVNREEEQEEKIDEKTIDIGKSNSQKASDGTKLKYESNNIKNNYMDSEVRKFFESNGLEVVDNRMKGGRLWVIGDKIAIRNIVNTAIAKFRISGKYTSSKEIENLNGWCTKTDK